MMESKYCLLSMPIFVLLMYFSAIDVLKAQTLNERELKEVRGSAVSACFRNQKSSALNNNLNDSIILNYCRCFANTMFPPHMTVEELSSAVSILKRSGNQAYMDFLLKGRDLYEIVENCTNQSLK